MYVGNDTATSATYAQNDQNRADQPPRDQEQRRAVLLSGLTRTSGLNPEHFRLRNVNNSDAPANSPGDSLTNIILSYARDDTTTSTDSDRNWVRIREPEGITHTRILVVSIFRSRSQGTTHESMFSSPNVPHMDVVNLVVIYIIPSPESLAESLVQRIQLLHKLEELQKEQRELRIESCNDRLIERCNDLQKELQGIFLHFKSKSLSELQRKINEQKECFLMMKSLIIKTLQRTKRCHILENKSTLKGQ